MIYLKQEDMNTLKLTKKVFKLLNKGESTSNIVQSCGITKEMGREIIE